MANSSKKAIDDFLDESFEDESDVSNVYDSDADPEYRPGENNTNIQFVLSISRLRPSAHQKSKTVSSSSELFGQN